MITYGSEVAIGRPPADVWPYIVERDKQALWSDVPMEPLTSGPLQPGSRMRLHFGKGPISASVTLEITAREEHERFAWTTVSNGGIHWDGAYRLAGAPSSGTRLSQEGTLRFRGLWRLVEPFVGGEIRAAEVAELEKLKATLEGAPSAEPTAETSPLG